MVMSVTCRRLRLFAVWCALALPCGAAMAAVSASTQSAPAPTPAPGSVDSSQIRLEAGDAAGALADAELVIASGGGADAFDARADAKRALGGPYEEVLADHAQAAKLDPRYIIKHRGFIAQHASEVHPAHKMGATGLNGVPMRFIVGICVLGALSIIAGVVTMLRRRAKPGIPISTDGKPAAAAAAAAVGAPSPPGMPKPS